MNNIALSLLRTTGPYLVCFLMGILLGWKGCGDSSGGHPVTQTIEVDKPVYITEYVDRWRTDTVRFVSRHVVTVHDTAHDIRVDTLFMVDTVSIVEAWLTEVTKYDTLVVFENKASVNLKWQNYQNISEGLFVSYNYSKSTPTTWSLGLHGNAGLLTDFDRSYKPLFGLGLQGTVRKTYIGLDYGYNSDHYIGLRVGRLLISK